MEGLHEFHGGQFGAHIGIRRTYEKIQSKYLRPRLYLVVQLFVKGCDLCHRLKMTTTWPYKIQQSVEVDVPFHTVELHIIRPFQVSQSYKFVMAAKNYLAKFFEAKVARNIEASTVRSSERGE